MAGDYSGVHRAFVVSNKDPENRGRLLVTLPRTLSGDTTFALPEIWVEACRPTHARDLPAAGTGVLVMFEFPATELSTGFWLGMVDYLPSGFSETPNVAQRTPDIDFAAGRGGMAASFGDMTDLGGPEAETITEPQSFQDTTYGTNHAAATPGGIVEEKDDGKGTYDTHRYNRMVGAHQVEVRGDGTEYRRASMKLEFLLGEDRVVDGDKREAIGGDKRELVEGDASLEVDGSVFAKTGPVRAKLASLEFSVDGDDEAGTRLTTLSDVTLETLGTLFMMAGEYCMTAAGNASVAAGGMATLHGNVAAQVASTGITRVAGSQVVIGATSPIPLPEESLAVEAATAGQGLYTRNLAGLISLLSRIMGHRHDPITQTMIPDPAAMTAATAEVVAAIQGSTVLKVVI